MLHVDVRKMLLKNDPFEKKYKKFLDTSSQIHRMEKYKLSLPIKVADGKIKKQFIKPTLTDIQLRNESFFPFDDSLGCLQGKTTISDDKLSSESIKTIHLLVSREKKLITFRYNIGSLCTEVIADPYNNISNLSILLKLMDESPETLITIRKLAAGSLLEVFKDILPSFYIKLGSETDTKLRNKTLSLHQYEAALLRYYKQYLKKLEKIANALKKKACEVQLSGSYLNLGAFAVCCLLNLLSSRPDFNFSSNIAKYLIPFLECDFEEIRKIIHKNFIAICDRDKRGDVSLTIVQEINYLLKQRPHLKYTDVFLILLHINIKCVDFNAICINVDSDQDLKKNKNFLTSKKERIKKNKL
ncbi:nucleolar complex protein 3 homolog, partial [Copidosoma floridanum]|uniref:nucleolar complex protein 3 homolog n=1 Tax=Copidosoma floridanum TaxID=29053 RepID=UPI0006C9A804